MNKIVSKIRLLLVVGVLIPCLLTSVSCFLVACDEQGIPDIDDIMDTDEQENVVGENLQITDWNFSDDHKYQELWMRLVHDVGGYDLTDSMTVVARPLQELQFLPGKFVKETQPLVKRVSNTSREALQKLKTIHMKKNPKRNNNISIILRTKMSLWN